jgi:DNA polymerase-4
MNAFYASVECLYHPKLRDKPVAVAGDVEQRHGIILAKNQIAKKYGVTTGEAIWQAKQKCPGLVTVTAHYDLYMQFSYAARKIYEDYTDQIEAFGLDECWLDITGSGILFGSGEGVAQELRQRIKRELGVTFSIGVSWNKIFAKLGSDYKKPDAVTIIARDNYKSIVWSLPASDLLYVGPATTRKLARYGIHTIGQLAIAPPDYLHGLLGKWGETLWAFSNGYDLSPVTKMDYSSAIKSVGNSMTTYRDIESPEDAWKVYVVLSESVARRLRENGFRARTVQISIRDVNLSWQERQAKLKQPCCTAYELAVKAMELFDKNYDFHIPLRSLGVRACDLTDSTGGMQLMFFGDELKRERREQLESSVDLIRGRFGNDSVKRAILLGANIVGESDPLTHVVHPVSYNF